MFRVCPWEKRHPPPFSPESPSESYPSIFRPSKCRSRFEARSPVSQGILDRFNTKPDSLFPSRNKSFKSISPRCRVQFFVHFWCTRQYCDDILQAFPVRQWLPTLPAATRESARLVHSAPKLSYGWPKGRWAQTVVNHANLPLSSVLPPPTVPRSTTKPHLLSQKMRRLLSRRHLPAVPREPMLPVKMPVQRQWRAQAR